MSEKPFADYPSYTPIMDYLKRKAKDSSEAGRSPSGGAPAEGTAHNSLGGGTEPAQAPATIYVWFAANGNIRKWDTKSFPEGTPYSRDAAFCPVSEKGCQENPVCPWPCKRLKPCPYCASDNEAIRDTYYDQNCEGCVKRIGTVGGRDA